MIAALLTPKIIIRVGRRGNLGIVASRGNVITVTRSLLPVTQIDARGVGQETIHVVDPRERNLLRDPDLDRGQNLVREKRKEEKTVMLVRMPIGITGVLKKRILIQRTIGNCRQ